MKTILRKTAIWYVPHRSLPPHISTDSRHGIYNEIKRKALFMAKIVPNGAYQMVRTIWYIPFNTHRHLVHTIVSINLQMPLQF